MVRIALQRTRLQSLRPLPAPAKGWSAINTPPAKRLIKPFNHGLRGHFGGRGGKGERVQQDRVVTDRSSSPRCSASCTYESSKHITSPGTHSRLSVPTVNRAPGPSNAMTSSEERMLTSADRNGSRNTTKSRARLSRENGATLAQIIGRKGGCLLRF